MTNKVAFKKGMSFYCFPPWYYKPKRIHIMQVFTDFYKRHKLIIYRHFIKGKYWNEAMCTDAEMKMFVDRYKIYLKDKRCKPVDGAKYPCSYK